MPTYYHDTSALVKQYHSESGTNIVNRIFAEPNSFHFVCRLTIVELHSALALKVRTGILSADEFHKACCKLKSDWSGRVFHSIIVTSGHMRSAEALIKKHGLTNSLRTLDAMQLAIVLEMQARGLTVQLVSADKNLCRVASTESLAIINPDLA